MAGVGLNQKKKEGELMSLYLAYWKRGWWTWLLMLLANISAGVLILPLAFAFGSNKPMYWVSAVVVWLLIGAPCWGWLFETFAKNSIRLGTQNMSSGAAEASNEQHNAVQSS
jgi:hypothetical protein